MNWVELAHQKGYRCDREGNVFGPKGTPVKTRGVYPRFHFRIPGRKIKWALAHRLQAFQKFGAAMFKEGIEVRHLDGNPGNAHWDNLALGTRSENAMDKTPETRLRSARTASAAMKKHDHAAIISHYTEFGFNNTLRSFGIGKGALSFILNKSEAAKLRILREEAA